MNNYFKLTTPNTIEAVESKIMFETILRSDQLSPIERQVIGCVVFLELTLPQTLKLVDTSLSEASEALRTLSECLEAYYTDYHFKQLTDVPVKPQSLAQYLSALNTNSHYIVPNKDMLKEINSIFPPSIGQYAKTDDEIKIYPSDHKFHDYVQVDKLENYASNQHLLNGNYKKGALFNGKFGL